MNSDRLAQLTRARIYEIAAAHCKPLFPALPLKDQDKPPVPAVDGEANADVDALIAATERELAAAIADKFAALRAAARATNPAVEASSDGAITDLITPGHAVYLSGIPRPTLHRLCTRHPIGTPDGFSLKREGERRFLISQSRLESFLRKRPLRVRRNETKKLRPET